MNSSLADAEEEGRPGAACQKLPSSRSGQREEAGWFSRWEGEEERS